MQRKRLLFTEILGKRPWLWCNTCNLPNLEVGLVFKQVVTTAKAPSSFLTLEKLAMKKTLIALAVLAASGASFAQSSVTLSGTYSFSYQKDVTNTAANGALVTVNSARGGNAVAAAATNVDGKGFAVTDANLKLAAVEDLGGGLKASFDYTLETGAFRGAPATRADSGIAVSGSFGAVALRNTRGSDLIASIVSPAISLPDGLYDNLAIVSRGSQDQFIYTSPAFNGFTAQYLYVEANDGAISLPTADGVKSAQVYGLSYAAGPLSVTAAIKANSLQGTTSVKKNQQELAVSYDLGVAKVGYAFDGKETNTGTNANGVSVTVPMGAVTLGVQSFKRGVLKQTDFGASYAFSKRTSLNVASGKLSGHATEANNGTQSRVQLKHTF
jgi:predicted porin